LIEVDVFYVSYLEKYQRLQDWSNERLIENTLLLYRQGYLSYESRAVGVLSWYRRKGTLNKNQQEVLVHELSKIQKDDNGNNGQYI
jgi:hypothetical protein